jgi:hypothetical protein
MLAARAPINDAAITAAMKIVLNAFLNTGLDTVFTSVLLLQKFSELIAEDHKQRGLRNT